MVLPMSSNVRGSDEIRFASFTCHSMSFIIFCPFADVRHIKTLEQFSVILMLHFRLLLSWLDGMM